MGSNERIHGHAGRGTSGKSEQRLRRDCNAQQVSGVGSEGRGSRTPLAAPGRASSGLVCVNVFTRVSRNLRQKRPAPSPRPGGGLAARRERGQARTRRGAGEKGGPRSRGKLSDQGGVTAHPSDVSASQSSLPGFPERMAADAVPQETPASGGAAAGLGGLPSVTA